jgi:hypothetical protein
LKLAGGTPAEQRRQFIILGLLVLVGVWLFFWPPWAPAPVAGPPPPRAGAVPSTAELLNQTSKPPSAAPKPTAATSAMPEPLKLSELKAVGEETSGSRDPFGFGIPPRPPARPPVAYIPPPTPTPTPPPVDPGPPPRPKIPVKFLGFAEDPSRPGKLVSLSLNGAVIVAREGDVIDGRYRLLKVGLASIVMAYLDGQGQTTIPLSGA